MTNNICQTAQAPVDSKYTGQAFQLNVVVHVRWAWLVLPVLLVVCSAVFLVLSVLQTRSSRVNAWKSSPLALLFSGVEGNLRNTAQDNMGTFGGLVKVVGKLRAALSKNDGLWQFKEVDLTEQQST
jgi:hypothetical protein